MRGQDPIVHIIYVVFLSLQRSKQAADGWRSGGGARFWGLLRELTSSCHHHVSSSERRLAIMNLHFPNSLAVMDPVHSHMLSSHLHLCPTLALFLSVSAH